jgi:hypothetical protein
MCDVLAFGQSGINLLSTSFILQDRDGTLRVTGEEWLVKKTGAYLPGAYEEVIDTVGAYVLNDKVH